MEKWILFKDGVQEIQDCDIAGLIGDYGRFLDNVAGFFEPYFAKYLTLIITIKNTNLDRDGEELITPQKSVDNFCSLLKNLEKNTVSAYIKDSLESFFNTDDGVIFTEEDFKNHFTNYFASRFLPKSEKVDLQTLFDQVTFEKFISGSKQRQAFKKLATERDLNQAFYNQAVSTAPYSSFAEELKKIVCKGLPESMRDKCALVDFNNVRQAKKELSQSAFEYLRKLFSETQANYPEFDIGHLIIKNLLQNVISGKGLEAVEKQVEIQLLNGLYEQFTAQQGACISETSFKAMISYGVLIRTEKGKFVINSETSSSKLAGAVVKFCLERAAISLTYEQKEKVIEQLSSRDDLNKLLGSIKCEELENFQNEVEKLVFPILAKVYVTNKNLSREQFLQIEANFLELCKSNLLKQGEEVFEGIGQRRILGPEFLDGWFEDQVIEVGREFTKELYSTEGPSPEALKAITTMLNEGEFGREYYQLTTNSAKSGGNLGGDPTPTPVNSRGPAITAENSQSISPLDVFAILGSVLLLGSILVNAIYRLCFWSPDGNSDTNNLEAGSGTEIEMSFLNGSPHSSEEENKIPPVLDDVTEPTEESSLTGVVTSNS